MDLYTFNVFSPPKENSVIIEIAFKLTNSLSSANPFENELIGDMIISTIKEKYSFCDVSGLDSLVKKELKPFIDLDIKKKNETYLSLIVRLNNNVPQMVVTAITKHTINQIKSNRDLN